MSDKPSQKETDQTQTSAGKTHLLAEGLLLAERYRIGDVLGLGGMGMVYKARDETLNIDVALKVLRDESESSADSRTLDRFQQELILARQVSHRNVVRIHDIGKDGKIHFLTMDLIEGRSLKEIIQQSGTLPIARALDFTRQIAAGLEAAHETGVVHRDLKPANILVDENNVAYITDFGVARSANITGLTKTGHIVGTPDYLSPEQARGGDLDGRSDIYSLGLILYEMLSGQLPFSGETYHEVLAQRMMGKPRDLEELGIEVPASVKQIIEHCLARDPGDRYDNAGQLVADLGSGQATQLILKKRSKLAHKTVTIAVVLMSLAAGGWALFSIFNQTELLTSNAPGTESRAVVVAVLPLEDVSGRSDLAWLRTGIPELVADNLAESAALQLVDPNRVFRTLADLNMLEKPGSAANIRQAAELLGAGKVVTGNIRVAGERIRIDARITSLDPATPTEQQFFVEVADASEAFQLISKFTDALRTSLAPNADQGIDIVRLSNSETALRAYTEGVGELYLGNSVAAAPALEKAVEQDPDFAAAWLRLSDAYDELGYGEKSTQAIQNASALLVNDNSRVALETRAREAVLSGDLERAQSVLATLVERYPGDSESRIALALAHEDEGELDQAMMVLRKVIETDPNHPRAWFLMGKYAILSGDSQTAIDELLVRALVIQNRLGNDQGRADVLNAMGIAYHQLAQLDQAEEQYRLAAEIRARIGDQRGVASSLTNLARILVSKGEHDKARVQFAEAMRSREAIGDTHGQAVLHNEIGLLEESLGRYSEALQQFRMALNIRRQLGDKRALTESYSNVGFAYYTLGEYDNASVYWQQALETATELDNKEDIMLAMQNIGLLDFARGQWDKALKAFLQTLEDARNMGSPIVQAVALGNLGRIATIQGRFSAAEKSLDDAIALLRDVGDQRGQAEYTLFKIELLIDLGQKNKAETLIAQAGELLTDSGNNEQLAEFNRLQATLALMNNNVSLAARLFDQAILKAQESGNKVIGLRAQIGAVKARLLSGRSLGAEIDQLSDAITLTGNIPLQLQATELFAQIANTNNDTAGAERLARQIMRSTQSTGVYQGTWRAQQILARSLQAQGETESAARAMASARAEIKRLSQNMNAEQLTSFEQLPGVKELSDDT